MPAKISHKCVTSAHKATAFRKKKEKHSFGTLNESLGLTSGDFVLRFREFEENLLVFLEKQGQSYNTQNREHQQTCAAFKKTKTNGALR